MSIYFPLQKQTNLIYILILTEKKKIETDMTVSVLIIILIRVFLNEGAGSVGLVIERSRVQVPAGAAGEFSSPGSTFCADSYFGIRSTPVLLLSHVKDPDHSPKSAGGRVQLKTHTPYLCGFE